LSRFLADLSSASCFCVTLKDASSVCLIPISSCFSFPRSRSALSFCVSRLGRAVRKSIVSLFSRISFLTCSNARSNASLHSNSDLISSLINPKLSRNRVTTSRTPRMYFIIFVFDSNTHCSRSVGSGSHFLPFSMDELIFLVIVSDASMFCKVVIRHFCGPQWT